jgi:low temperature requirement protein LtrA
MKLARTGEAPLWRCGVLLHYVGPATNAAAGQVGCSCNASRTLRKETPLVSVTDVHRGNSAALDAAPKGRAGRRHVVHPDTALHRGDRHAVLLGHPALRTADGHHRDERRASWLELFFDLAFAGAVGQLAGAFQRHPSLAGLAGFVILFTPIWWLWVQLTFYADRHETKDAAHRISVLAAILLCVALAASAPRALTGHPAGFVIAFVCLRGLQLLLYARAWRHLPATRPLYGCYLIWFSAGGALWLASLSVGGSARYAFWGVALIADAVGSLAMLTPRRRLPLNSKHLADRFQIFVLIVLGESMARLISAAAARPWSLPLAVVLAAALITLAALWWAWLTAADRSALDSPAAIARFTALNLPLAAGSAGLHIAILAADGATTIAVAPRAALYGGVSICLLASVLLPSTKLTAPARAIRAVTALAAMGLVFMGAIVEPVYLVPALTAVLALGLTAEARQSASADDPAAARFTYKEHPCPPS